MKPLILLTLILAGCGNNASTSSGGGAFESKSVLTGKLAEAFNLVKHHYDFSGLYISLGDTGGNWMVYYPNHIVVNEYYLNLYSVEENACALGHEWVHHIGGNQEDAFAEQKQCLEIIGNKNG